MAGLTTRLSALMPATARLDVVAPDGPVWIRGDAGALERVVQNLVANAADAVADGGHVRVAVLRAAASSGGAPVPSAPSAAIEVSDTGVGMDASVQARLFEPFFTTKANVGAMATAGAGVGAGAGGSGALADGAAAAPRAKGGTGLGLPTAFGIVSQHGGTITVESAPRQGSRFTVLLPTIPA